MAIDTRNRRASAGACGLVMLVALPIPDGTIGAADRAHSAGFYAGIALDAPVSLVAVPDSTIQLHGQVRALSPQTQDAIQLDVQTQTLWIN